MMEDRMTLQQAIDHTWEVYQKQVLRRAWSKLHDVPKAEKENCERCAEEHKQLHEWLKELKAYRNKSEIQTSCEDAISREEAVNAIYDLCGENVSLKENPWRDNPHMDAVVDALENLPSVTPHQKTGRWIPVGYDGYADGNPVYDWWECSECGWEHTGDEESLTAFCPNCGAKMEVEE